MSLYYQNTTAQSEQTIRDMMTVRYKIYKKSTKYTILAVGASIMLFSAWLFYRYPGQNWPMLPMFLGCWLVAAINVPPRSQANQLLRALNGQYHTTTYSFDEEFVTASEKGRSQKWEYWRFIRFGETEACYVLFLNEEAALVLLKSGFSVGESESFRAFFEEKASVLCVSEIPKEKKSLYDIFMGR